MAPEIGLTRSFSEQYGYSQIWGTADPWHDAVNK